MAKGDEGKWYRVLRPSETPSELRLPPAALSQMGAKELRREISLAAERGNVRPSPFLHVTDQVKNAIKVWAERRQLYQPVMVRFPKEAVPPEATWAFTCQPGSKKGLQLLNEASDDDKDIEDALPAARAYVVKDREAVLLQHPSYGVEWFDVHSCTWKEAGEP